MIVVDGWLALIVGMMVFASGLLVGGWLRDLAWSEKASGCTRMAWRGRFYWVTHDRS